MITAFATASSSSSDILDFAGIGADAKIRFISFIFSFSAVSSTIASSSFSAFSELVPFRLTSVSPSTASFFCTFILGSVSFAEFAEPPQPTKEKTRIVKINKDKIFFIIFSPVFTPVKLLIHLMSLLYIDVLFQAITFFLIIVLNN